MLVPSRELYGCWTKNRGGFYPKNGWFVYNGSKPYEQMDDLGGNFYPLFLVQLPYNISPIPGPATPFWVDFMGFSGSFPMD